MMTTLFQKIIAREISAEILHEDDACIAIRDIEPQAPVHILIIPKKLIPRVAFLGRKGWTVIGQVVVDCSKNSGRRKLR